MLFGVGIDIENYNRFLKYHTKNSSKYLLSVFTEKELNNYAEFDTHLSFAISFCCKESFFKSFGYSWFNSDMEWYDIELIFNKHPKQKKASVLFSGFAKELIISNNIINPPYFNYTITESSIIFESILECKKK